MEIIIPKNEYHKFDIVLCNAFFYDNKDKLLLKKEMFYCEANGLEKFNIKKVKKKDVTKCRIEFIKKVGSQINELKNAN